MSGPIESVNAVTLVTADMAASVAFYDALGFVLVAGGADAAFSTYRMESGSAVTFLNVQLDPVHAPVARIWGRVIFFVDDVDAVHARAVAGGYPPRTEPTNAAWGERYFHIHDPAGHELSFARPIATDLS